MKQIPPHPHAAAMGFKAPAGKKLSGAGSEDRKESNGKRDHVMALPAWGGLPKEVVDQNLAKHTRFSHPPPIVSRGKGWREVVPEGRTGSIPLDFKLV